MTLTRTASVSGSRPAVSEPQFSGFGEAAVHEELTNVFLRSAVENRRSDAERAEVLPTERERPADGFSRHRTNNSAACGYLRAVYRLLKVGGVAVGPTFSSR